MPRAWKVCPPRTRLSHLMVVELTWVKGTPTIITMGVVDMGTATAMGMGTAMAAMLLEAVEVATTEAAAVEAHMETSIAGKVGGQALATLEAGKGATQADPCALRSWSTATLGVGLK